MNFTDFMRGTLDSDADKFVVLPMHVEKNHRRT